MEKLLEVSDLHVAFPSKRETVRAVDGVSFQVFQGETFGLVGESGCGKSQTLRSILGLLKQPGRITGGEIRYKGADIAKMSQRELQKIRGKEISMIFQEPMTALNPVFTVGDQIAETLMLHEGLERRAAWGRAEGLLAEVGIPEPAIRVRNYPFELSGGMRQRIMIAIALACRPAVLIADEPTTALDCVVKQQVIELFHSINEQQHVAIIMISHDLNLIRRYCDKVAVMYAGQIVESGGSNEVFSQPQHPYTQALLSVIPRLDQDRNVRLNEIPGYVPEHGRDTSHCLFQPRCSACRQECGGSVKSSRRDGHFVRCSKAWEECRA